MSAIGPPHSPDRQERPPKINVCGLRSQKVTSSLLLALFFPLWYVCYSATAGGGRETETEDASYVDTGHNWFEMMLYTLRRTCFASTPIVHNLNSPLCPRLLRTSGAQKYLFRCCLLLLLLSSPFLPLGGERGEESGGGLFLGATTRNGSSLSVFLVLRGWPDDRRRGDPILRGHI